MLEKALSAAAIIARKAADDFRKKLKDDPFDLPALRGLSEAMIVLGEKREAIGVLERLGAALQRNGKTLEAIAVYKRVEQLDPKQDVTASFMIGLELKRLISTAAAAKPGSTPLATPAATPAPFRPSSAASIAPASAPSSVPAPVPAQAAAPAPTPGPVRPVGYSSAISLPAPTDPSVKPLASSAPSAPPPTPEPRPIEIPPELKRRRELIRRAVSGIPLLKDVPPFLVELVLEKINLRTLEADETIFEEGSTGSSLIFVASGEVSVFVREQEGQESAGGRVVPIGTLLPGDVAGEISFLSGEPRSATLRAKTRTYVLELDRRALEPILRKHRALSNALQALYLERVLDGVLARSPLFSGLPRPERDWVAQRLTALSARPGDRIIRQGDADDCLYILKRGQVRVTTTAHGKEVALAMLSPHGFFGDVAPLRGTARTASVTAITAVELLVLKKADLTQLLARHPAIRGLLDDVQLTRFVATSQILSRS